jgi:hypothetical protein
MDNMTDNEYNSFISKWKKNFIESLNFGDITFGKLLSHSQIFLSYLENLPKEK